MKNFIQEAINLIESVPADGSQDHEIRDQLYAILGRQESENNGQASQSEDLDHTAQKRSGR